MQNPDPEHIPEHIWALIHDRTVALATELGFADDDERTALWALVEAERQQSQREELKVVGAGDALAAPPFYHRPPTPPFIYRAPNGRLTMSLSKVLPNGMISFSTMDVSSLEQG